jgi:hypothetical protein
MLQLHTIAHMADFRAIISITGWQLWMFFVMSVERFAGSRLVR